MATITLRLCVSGVPLVIKGQYSLSTTTSFGRHTLEHLIVQSVKLDRQDADLLDLLEGETLRAIDNAARRWAEVRERLTQIVAPVAPSGVEVTYAD